MHKKEKPNKIKKSQLYFVGSLLILIGVVCLSFNYILTVKAELFDEMKFKFFDEETNNAVEDTSVVDNIEETINDEQPKEKETPKVNYDYVGYLEIPAISLKRGFLSKGSKYNNIEYNVTVSEQSDYPDVPGGNLILFAHSGNAYIAFFNYLYKLKIGDKAYVTYNDKKYEYTLTKVEVQPKTGEVVIHRNFDVTTLTLITCTNNDNTTQSIYIFEIV